MPTSTLPVSKSERAALADLLEQLGPDRPTCCEGWTTRDIAAHVVVRDRRPDAGPGLVLGGPLRTWTQRLHARTRSARPYGVLVAELRSGPPAWLPSSWPAVDRVLNGAELVIHHEDVRRAQPEWTVRELSREDQDAVWTATAFYARRAGGRRGVVLRRSDVPGEERRVGAAGRLVLGEPMELLLWAAGRRDVARVTVS